MKSLLYSSIYTIVTKTNDPDFQVPFLKQNLEKKRDKKTKKKMKKMYNTTKNAIKKTALAGMIASEFALGGIETEAQSYLPISEKQKVENLAYIKNMQEINTLEKELNRTDSKYGGILMTIAGLSMLGSTIYYDRKKEKQ